MTPLPFTASQRSRTGRLVVRGRERAKSLARRVRSQGAASSVDAAGSIDVNLACATSTGEAFLGESQYSFASFTACRFRILLMCAELCNFDAAETIPSKRWKNIKR